MSSKYSPEIFNQFKPTKSFFIGLDSDGCVFDTMEIKQQECFTPNVIKYFGLQGVSKYAREVCLFVNLYSKWRGANRFIALAKDFELLAKRPEVYKRNFKLPDITDLNEWINNNSTLSNHTLKEYLKTNSSPFLNLVLEWSLEVNRTVTDIVKGIPYYPLVKESLDKITEKADVLVVSSTPCEALEREWQEHGIDKYPSIIAGQEMGSKSEHLKLAAQDKYDQHKILMVGDAIGDLKAAKSINALFYPILPGHEEASWEKFYKEALDIFFEGKYEGKYQEKLNHEFDKCLPSTPMWQEVYFEK